MGHKTNNMSAQSDLNASLTAMNAAVTAYNTALSNKNAKQNLRNSALAEKQRCDGPKTITVTHPQAGQPNISTNGYEKDGVTHYATMPLMASAAMQCDTWATAYNTAQNNLNIATTALTTANQNKIAATAAYNTALEAYNQYTAATMTPEQQALLLAAEGEADALLTAAELAAQQAAKESEANAKLTRNIIIGVALVIAVGLIIWLVKKK